MKNFLCCVLLASFVAPASAQTVREKLRDDLVRTEAEFFRHLAAHGFNAGLHAFMAPDGFIANSLVLGREAQAARANAETARRRVVMIRWKPLRAEVAESGELGYTWGVAESGHGGGSFRPYAIYVTIWRRLPDGTWKFVYDAATILAAEALERFLSEHFPAAETVFPRGDAAPPPTAPEPLKISLAETAR